MRKTYVTAALLAISIAAFAFVWFFERHLDSTKERAEALTQVIPFDLEKINALSWSGAESANGAILEEDGRWRLREPDGELVHPGWIKQVLASLGELRSLERITAAEFRKGKADIDTLGFEKGSWIDLATTDGTSLHLAIGKQGPLTGTVYLSPGRLPGQEDDVVLVRDDLASLLKIPAEKLVDPNLVRFDEAKLVSFQVRNGGHDIEISRKDPDAYWELVRPLHSRVGKDALTIPFLGITRALILDPLDVAPAFVHSEPAGLTLRLSPASGGAEVEIEAWRDPTSEKEAPTGIARSSDRPNWYRVGGDLLDLERLHPTLLRDRMLARINPDALQGILLRVPDNGELQVRLQGRQWIYKRGDTWERASSARVEKTVKALNESEVLAFHNNGADDPLYGLDQPFLKIAVTTLDGGIIREEDADGNSTILLRLAKGTDGKLYGAYSHEPFVYEIDPTLLSEIPLDPLRWKSPSVLGFSPLSLRKITIVPGTEPPLEMSFDPFAGGWTATRAGTDLTAMLDLEKAEAIGSTLSSFQADQWIGTRGAALSALQNPSLLVRITIEQGRPDGSTALLPIELAFAPTSSDARESSTFYYGMIKGVQDIFLLHRDRYQLLRDGALDRGRLLQQQR